MSCEKYHDPLDESWKAAAIHLDYGDQDIELFPTVFLAVIYQ